MQSAQGFTIRLERHGHRPIVPADTKPSKPTGWRRNPAAANPSCDCLTASTAADAEIHCCALRLTHLLLCRYTLDLLDPYLNNLPFAVIRSTCISFISSNNSVPSVKEAPLVVIAVRSSVCCPAADDADCCALPGPPSMLVLLPWTMPPNLQCKQTNQQAHMTASFTHLQWLRHNSQAAVPYHKRV